MAAEGERSCLEWTGTKYCVRKQRVGGLGAAAAEKYLAGAAAETLTSQGKGKKSGKRFNCS